MRESTALNSKQGSVLGGILLIAGSCIGAGMLGLPILTGIAGFFPSLVMLLIAAFFMTTTALLLVEVTQRYSEKANYLTMMEKTLGPIGKILCWLFYLFVFYALLIAYIAASGNHVSSLLPLPASMGSLFFVLLFGGVVFFGTHFVDMTNRALMVGKIAAYLVVLTLGFIYIDPKLLMHSDPKYTLLSFPILIISFGFHNMIPVLSDDLGRDVKRMKQAILGGASFTFLIYLFWQIVALGTLPLEGAYGILASYKTGIDAAQALSALHTSSIGIFATLLAFFAILTSFLAQTLSLVHFLADGLKVRSGKKENLLLLLLTLMPPLFFAIVNPTIFYAALNFAGGFCAVVLFGLLPVLMVWKERKTKEATEYIVSGGTPLLMAILAIALFVLFYQTTQMSGLSIFPTVK